MDDRPDVVALLSSTSTSPTSSSSRPILLNSQYADSVVNDNLRYIDWTRGPRPAVLDAGDLPALRASPKLFARKFDVHHDPEVLDLIDADLLREHRSGLDSDAATRNAPRTDRLDVDVTPGAQDGHAGPPRGARERRRTAGSTTGRCEGWLPRLDLRELWASREIAAVLALRNIKIRYKQTFFGVAWALLQPLAAVAIFTLVFGRLAELPSEGIPYPVFVFSGLIRLVLLLRSPRRSRSESLAQYRELVTKVYFPASAGTHRRGHTGLVDFAVSLVALGVFMAVFGVAPNAAHRHAPALARRTRVADVRASEPGSRRSTCSTAT